MEIKEFKKIMEKLNIPIRYRAFPIGTQTTPPFIIYYEEKNKAVFADNIHYFSFQIYAVELYTVAKDPNIEKQIEELFKENSWIYDKFETYIDAEQLIEIIYYVEVI